MPKLHDMIEAKKQTEGFKTEDYETQQKEEIALSDVLDRLDFQLTKKELGGFKREEVIEAAKFSLRAKSYGLVPGDLKVDDSPIYYDSNHKSRWFFNRKSIRDVAEKVIEKARAQWQQTEQKKETQRTSAMEALSFTNVSITDVNEADYVPKTDEDFTQQLENSEAYKSVGQITEHPDVMSSLEEALLSSESENAVWDTEKKEQEDAAVLKKQLDAVDATLLSALPPATDMKKLVVDSIQEKMLKVIDDSYKEMGSASPKRKQKQFLEQGEALIKRIDEMYAAVKAGELSPETVKIFLKTELMGFATRTEKKIYENMVKRTEKDIPEPEAEDVAEYKEALYDLTEFFDHESSVSIQDEGNLNHFYRSLLKKKTVQRVDSEEDAHKLAIDHANNFIHYKGSKYIHAEKSGKNSKTATRYYVTVKPGTQTQLLNIMETMLKEDAEENGSDNSICKRIYFKVMGSLDDRRRDNMVIYKNDLIPDKEMKAFLDKLYKKCKEMDIIADRDHSLCATQPLEGMEGGITTAPEFDTNSFYNTLITFGLFTDKEMDGLLYQGINGKESKSVTKPRFSYNTYMAKSVLYSAEIISQKEGIPRSEVTLRIKTDEAIRKKFKKYVSDFIRLGGVDISTMKTTGVKK
jgi:hypothetical protein